MTDTDDDERQRAALGLLTLLGFTSGFIAALNDISIPHPKAQPELCMVGAHLTMAPPTGQ
ncbi:hypothetical protein DB30_07296 [Enhygromyxa salina]|uniref:Uncharacterized protein n=1 Tax=Enhygromyxa salina TaxID=215803 RepID=A0A0C1Z8S9_9BACT|nr:hypothetical protein [Enhygromyxa salina]KIG14029.1 hypothetical protein DB30_07296 [Enhygromyxa salina]